MTNTTKKIEAIVEIVASETEPPWAIAPFSNLPYIKLSSAITSDEIGSIILIACSYNQIEVSSSATETLEAFLAKEFVLPGGLIFSEDGEIKVAPGCCCGLEDWREWLSVPIGNYGVWAGHDPNPGVEFIDGKIRVWQDEKAEGIEFIDFDIEEMNSLLQKVEADLKGFIYRLGKWTEFIAPNLDKKMVEHFTKNMSI